MRSRLKARATAARFITVSRPPYVKILRQNWKEVNMSGNIEIGQTFELMTIDKESTVVINDDGSLTIVGNVTLSPGVAKVTSSKADSFQYSESREGSLPVRRNADN
jgi:hypothetical protein